MINYIVKKLNSKYKEKLDKEDKDNKKKEVPLTETIKSFIKPGSEVFDDSKKSDRWDDDQWQYGICEEEDDTPYDNSPINTGSTYTMGGNGMGYYGHPGISGTSGAIGASGVSGTSSTSIDKKYQELVCKINQSIKYSEYIAENLNNNINYTEYLSSRTLDQSTNYAEYIAENLNKSIRYNEYKKPIVKKEVNKVISDIDPYGEEDWEF